MDEAPNINHSEAEYDRLANSLSEVMGMYRYEMTPFEAQAWKRIINSVSASRFEAFLAHHIATSEFAPRPSNAAKALDLTLDPAVAFEHLLKLVSQYGPYQTPDLAEPVLITTIQLLGGWPTVNANLPGTHPDERHALRHFRERFDACFNQAVAHVRVNRQLPTAPLLAIGQASAQPQLACRVQEGSS